MPNGYEIENDAGLYFAFYWIDSYDNKHFIFIRGVTQPEKRGGGIDGSEYLTSKNERSSQ